MKKENFGPKEIRIERKYFGPNINGKLKLLHIFEFKSGVREGEGILVYRYGKKIFPRSFSYFFLA